MLYTKRGDKGETDLADGRRVSKTSPRIRCVGTLDELNASIGLLIAHMASLPDLSTETAALTSVQRFIFGLGARTAAVPHGRCRLPGPEDTEALERGIDEMEDETGRVGENGNGPKACSFVLPGGHLAAAQAHVARTIARRAEISLLEAGAATWQNAPETLPYINRLSDYLFALGKKINRIAGINEIKY